MSWYVKGSGSQVYQCKTNTHGQLTDFVSDIFLSTFKMISFEMRNNLH